MTTDRSVITDPDALRDFKKSVESFQTRFLPLACDWYDVHAAL